MKLLPTSVLCVAASVLLAGCSGFTNPFSSDSSQLETQPVDANPGFQDEQGRMVSDPIAQFAVNNAPGKSSFVTLSDNRRFYVTVGQDYTSANGVACRRIFIGKEKAHERLSAVCLAKNVWQTVLLP